MLLLGKAKEHYVCLLPASAHTRVQYHAAALHFSRQSGSNYTAGLLVLCPLALVLFDNVSSRTTVCRYSAR
jgi:hypothetical protein